MSNLQNRIDVFLLEAGVMIENALSDPQVKQALEGYGYNEDKLSVGKKLYDEAMVLQNAQKKEYGEQVAATAELNGIWETADKQYMRALKIARVAFQGNAKVNKSIMLYGTRKPSLSGWLEQTKAFYANILGDDELLNLIAGYGYTREKLQTESALLDQVTATHMQQKKEIGEAQNATQARDKVFDDLAKWVSDLRAVAKVALEDNPQHLEKLGILARTAPKAQAKQGEKEKGSVETTV